MLEAREVPAFFTAAAVPELIAAIDAANLTPEADTITLVAGKTFTLTASNNITEGANGTPVVTAGSTIHIIGNGDVIERSSAIGTPAFRLFDVAAGGSLTLTNLTLQGGVAVCAPAFPDVGLQGLPGGGAILNRGDLSLADVAVLNNRAEGSSALVDLGWSVAGFAGEGGGVYSSGTLTMTGCTLRDNFAIGSRGADGAAYYNGNGSPGSAPPQPGQPGGAARGGAVYLAGGTAVIADSAFERNVAKGGAGGKGMKRDGGREGGTGGNASGGSVYVGAGAVTLQHVKIVTSKATGGAGGKGGGSAPDGAKGFGLGGGIFIAPAAFVSLDPFTVNHIKNNHASTADDDISGL
jgi:hypothetical protein